MEVLLLYFLFINILVFIFAGYDKSQARKNNRRIPEKTLFLMALTGGSPGLLTAMLLFRHKTSKTSFIVKFAVILLIQVALILAYVNYKK
ncbi:hypothetical protein BB050_01588 [Flavobacterium anhuiense]|uniref:DUF1294 domain-containing protein n=1 Tax=Flavobacterium anhuiense TaxID=459526 RepID=A0AAC9CZ86_9FLAO|nr:DUF1294 domain-containing protein [Flavobacterium anhuiense]AOC94715.1 hypothetical protein BB050_01588 [Flavobacterium anhuiense]URM37875.1 DUF1294 domain-containing protein [Flavobacterium anhuiense]